MLKTLFSYARLQVRYKQINISYLQTILHLAHENKG